MKAAGQIIILLFIGSLLVQFQNCSVYKSDGRKEFESSIEQAEDKGCYPYIDTNIAMSIIGSTDESFDVFKSHASGEDAYVCDFQSAGHILSHINCKVSQGNAELAVLLKQNGSDAFAGTVATWASASRSGFTGSIHGGYITLDTDGMYTVKYLAWDGTGEIKGVGCAVRILPSDYASATTQVQTTMSQLTLEMAIQNNE